MTDGLEAARRSEVAKSFRYARAFYDEAEAAGPAGFERNRQAIIDVIALAYRDGRASARAGESALKAAAQRFKAANEALMRLHEREAVDATNTDAEWAGLVADAWFEHDRARDALYAALAAYQGGGQTDAHS